MITQLRLDERGFLWFGDFKLPMRYLRERGLVEFLDRDKRRSANRGSRVIYVPLVTFLAGFGIELQSAQEYATILLREQGGRCASVESGQRPFPFENSEAIK